MNEIKYKTNSRFEEASEGGYTWHIEEISGVNTQGETLEEVKNNLIEALQLMMETQRTLSKKEMENRKVIRESLQLV